MAYKYQYGIIGGTFDHLHIGHKKLIDTAFSLSEKVTLGLSTQNLYKEKFLANIIDSYQTRESELKSYLKEKNYLPRADIIPLEDIFGPSLQIKDIDAIFVTQTTLPNAKIINEARRKKGLPELEIITVPFVKDELGANITSERIRLGEISREGHVYINIFKNKEKLNLPLHLREQLRKPIGSAVTDVRKIKDSITKESLLITVGDIVTKSLRDINCMPDIEIIDFKTRRSSVDEKLISQYKKMNLKIYRNEPGSIHKEVIDVYLEAVRNCVTSHKKQTIIIEGEEDLLTLPAILLAPLRSLVCYGQFDLEAVIMVDVTEEKKQFVMKLLEKFDYNINYGNNKDRLI